MTDPLHAVAFVIGATLMVVGGFCLLMLLVDVMLRLIGKCIVVDLDTIRYVVEMRRRGRPLWRRRDDADGRQVDPATLPGIRPDADPVHVDRSPGAPGAAADHKLLR